MREEKKVTFFWRPTTNSPSFSCLNQLDWKFKKEKKEVKKEENLFLHVTQCCCGCPMIVDQGSNTEKKEDDDEILRNFKYLKRWRKKRKRKS